MKAHAERNLSRTSKNPIAKLVCHLQASELRTTTPPTLTVTNGGTQIMNIRSRKRFAVFPIAASSNIALAGNHLFFSQYIGITVLVPSCGKRHIVRAGVRAV